MASIFTTLTTARHCKTKNDDCGQQSNNQYSVDNVEKTSEKEIEGEEDVILGI